MLLPTQSAWQESSASRRLSGDPIPIPERLVEATQRRNTLLRGKAPALNQKQRDTAIFSVVGIDLTSGSHSSEIQPSG